MKDMQPDPPNISPDGRFYLEDDRWKPLPTSSPDSRTVARGVARGVSTVIAQLIVVFVVFPLVLVACLAGVHLVLPFETARIVSGIVAAALAVGLFVLIRRWR